MNSSTDAAAVRSVGAGIDMGFSGGPIEATGSAPSDPESTPTTGEEE